MTSPSAAPLLPFPPPAGVEPEFQLPPPRPIPEHLRLGRHAKKEATARWFGLFFAIACGGFWLLTAGTRLGFYFLALPYLPLVAAGTLALTAIVSLLNHFRAGAYAYVCDGIPVRARVTDVQLVVALTHNGVASGFRYDCTIQYVDPHDGQQKFAVVHSPMIEARLKEQTTTPLRVGLEVTGVGLPGRFHKTFTLYGFLQLSPEVDFVQRTDQDVRELVPAVQALKYLLATAAITLLLGSVMAGPSLSPWSFPDRAEPVPWAILAAIVFVAGSIGLGTLFRRRDRNREERLRAANQAARPEGRPIEQYTPMVTNRFFRVIAYAGGGVLPLVAGILGVTALNDGLDRSPARFETVPILDFRTNTTALVFRSYQVRYQRGGKTETLALPVETLAILQEISPQQGVLEWHEGWLGMPWVCTVRPVLSSSDAAK